MFGLEWCIIASDWLFRHCGGLAIPQLMGLTARRTVGNSLRWLGGLLTLKPPMLVKVTLAHNMARLLWTVCDQGLSTTPLLNLVLGYVEEQYAGMAAGFISTMQQVGGAFGVSVVGIFCVSILVRDASEGVSLAGRYAAAFSGAMIYNLVAVIVAAGLIALIARNRVSSQ